MKYVFISAWVVEDGFCPPEGINKIDICTFENIKTTLTLNPSELLCNIDKKSAIAEYLAGHGPLSQINDQILLPIIKQLGAKRDSKCSNKSTLVFEATRDLEVELEDVHKVFDNVYIYFEFRNKNNFNNFPGVTKEIDAIKASFALACPFGTRFNFLDSGWFFIDGHGNYIFVFTPNSTGNLTHQYKIAQEDIYRINRNHNVIILSKTAKYIASLFVNSLEQNAYKLKSFAIGWAALELIINETYVLFYDDISNTFLEQWESEDKRKLLVKWNNKKKGTKFTIAEKFIFAMAIYFQNDSEKKIAGDYNKFKNIYSNRNRAFHEGDVDDPTTPLSYLEELIREYYNQFLEKGYSIQ